MKDACICLPVQSKDSARDRTCLRPDLAPRICRTERPHCTWPCGRVWRKRSRRQSAGTVARCCRSSCTCRRLCHCTCLARGKLSEAPTALMQCDGVGMMNWEGYGAMSWRTVVPGYGHTVEVRGGVRVARRVQRAREASVANIVAPMAFDCVTMRAMCARCPPMRPKLAASGSQDVFAYSNSRLVASPQVVSPEVTYVGATVGEGSPAVVLSTTTGQPLRPIILIPGINLRRLPSLRRLENECKFKKINSVCSCAQWAHSHAPCGVHIAGCRLKMRATNVADRCARAGTDARVFAYEK